MVSQNRIPFFGWVCLVGGVLEVVMGILYLLLFGGQASKDTPALELLFLGANICLMGGPLGLLVLRAFGSGGARILGKTGVVVTLLGLLSYIMAAMYILLYPVQEFHSNSLIYVFLPAGALLSTLGMLLVGIATLRGKQLRGRAAFAPLLIPIGFVLNVGLQMIYVLATGQHQSLLLPIVVLCFGPMWMLVGSAIQSSATGKLAVAARAIAAQEGDL